MSDTLSAFFLCAGYGKRLRPLTDRVPKPAIPFQGRTALEINFRLCRPLFPNRILCNTHHLYAEMEKPARRLGMSILYEPEILGTGGCLHNARHILETTDRFLVHNGDLIHTLDLKDLMARHRASGNIGTLAGIFRPTHNTLSVDVKGRLLGVHGFEGFGGVPAPIAAAAGQGAPVPPEEAPLPAGGEMARLTFAGIAIYEKAFLDFVKPGCEDIKPYWTAALRAGHSIGVANYSHDAAWFDFGTPQGLWEAARFYMELTRNYSYGYAPDLRESRPFVSNEANVQGLPEALRDVLIYEKSATPISPHTMNRIIGSDFRWEIKS
ncbi:MAG TPA: sugar phosphate nucleotidyltransferase [Fibrobacteria bacterium]|nr:sugar phosphate nucleotidyltransferase [Fibrobacteria bacterium]